MNKEHKVESILVSVTYNEFGKANLMVVGKKDKGEFATIINAMQGDDADRLYNELIGKKE